MRARAEEAMPLPRELRQVGVRLDLGETLDLEAVGMLDDRVAADALTRRLAALLGNRGTRLTMRAMGLGALLAGTRVNAEGARVRLRTVVGADDRPAVSAALRSLLGMVPGPGT
jgi:hypothetical protein